MPRLLDGSLRQGSMARCAQGWLAARRLTALRLDARKAECSIGLGALLDGRAFD
jgi:hypothetical protein